MIKDALLSPDGRYRYWLSRSWEPERGSVLFIMLNPSTADAEKDDATIRSCCRLARAHGAGAIEVVNLFAWRATKPDELLRIEDPVGPLNDQTIHGYAHQPNRRIIAAWGAHKSATKMPPWNAPAPIGVATSWDRSKRVRDLIAPRELLCFGRTYRTGAPRHPLYVRSDSQLEVYHGK